MSETTSAQPKLSISALAQPAAGTAWLTCSRNHSSRSEQVVRANNQSCESTHLLLEQLG
jgi:hypothetical protein